MVESGATPVAAFGFVFCLAFTLLFGSAPASAQLPQGQPVSVAQTSVPGANLHNAPAEEPQSETQASGSITGTILDQSGAFVSGAVVTLTRGSETSGQQQVSDEGGQFFFVNIAPGPFELKITAPGFADQTLSGTLQAEQVFILPKIILALATAKTEIHVVLTRAEVAQEQVKAQEKQRVLGVVPNFFVSYEPDAVPLTWKQKFGLAWKSSSDPITILAVAAVAGGEQATNSFKEYGQGAQGYGKRFGATYADVVDGTFLGSAIMPSLMKQDPRYFYKGTGSFRSRLWYALRSSVICKGDNEKWQPNYSEFLGNLAAGGIANAYYPANRRGVGLAFTTAGIRMGEVAVANVFQEFVSRRVTPGLGKHDADQR
ncbi:MAG TPA: carboxypeptidase-like regulatory domain-containing protein [Verrucomicrobiae bacterium]|nr:carboxypeptidase-like regulatory domain-containing protein [Verrucomicrobiae bacterium]